MREEWRPTGRLARDSPTSAGGTRPTACAATPSTASASTRTTTSRCRASASPATPDRRWTLFASWAALGPRARVPRPLRRRGPGQRAALPRPRRGDQPLRGPAHPARARERLGGGRVLARRARGREREPVPHGLPRRAGLRGPVRHRPGLPHPRQRRALGAPGRRAGGARASCRCARGAAARRWTATPRSATTTSSSTARPGAPARRRRRLRRQRARALPRRARQPRRARGLARPRAPASRRSTPAACTSTTRGHGGQHRPAHRAERDAWPGAFPAGADARAEVSLRVTNLLDERYAAGGYMDYDDDGSLSPRCSCRRRRAAGTRR